jgi:hypothetical protein
MLVTPRLVGSLAALGLITACAVPSSAADVASPPSQVAEQSSTSKETADSPAPRAQVVERVSTAKTAKEAVDSSTPSLQMAERMAEIPILPPRRRSGRISATKKAFDSPLIVDARPQPRAIFEHLHAPAVPVVLGVAY